VHNSGTKLIVMAKKKANIEKPVEALSAKEAKAEHARLEAEITAHDKRYYQDDARRSPTRNTTRCGGATRTSKSASPSCTRYEPHPPGGAAPAAKFKKVRHAVPMISLENAFSEEGVKDFIERVRRFLRLGEDEKIIFTPSPRSTAPHARCATRKAR